MKRVFEVILTALIFALLVGYFSFFAPRPTSTPSGGVGYRQKGDSGTAVPGGGSEPMQLTVLTAPETDPVETVDTPEQGSAPVEIVVSQPQESEALTGFWYGAGAVLLGQLVMLLCLRLGGIYEKCN